MNPENIKEHDNFEVSVKSVWHNLHNSAAYWQSKQKEFGVVTAIYCNILSDKDFKNLDLRGALSTKWLK